MLGHGMVGFASVLGGIEAHEKSGRRLFLNTSPGQSSPAWSAGIRRLAHGDLGAFREHLLRLDRESRQSRFAMKASDTFVARYAATAFSHDSTLFGLFEGGFMRAAAELRPVSGRAAEAAFSVEPEYRGQGVATALFARIIEDARALGARRIYMSCLSHNQAMQALARKFEAEFAFEPADPLQAHALPPHRVGVAKANDISSEFATATVRVGGGWRPFQARRG